MRLAPVSILGIILLSPLLLCIGSAIVITPITANSSVTHKNPAINGNHIVWSDDREGGFYATYLYDMITGSEIQISPAVSSMSQVPRISGNFVVYQDDSSGIPLVYLYDISTGGTTQVTSDLNGQSLPAISGSRIVWQDIRGIISQIFVGITTPGSEIAVSPGSSNQESPDISGDLVVWLDDRNAGQWDVYLYNLTSHQETRITDNPSNKANPAIYGNRIVWTDDRRNSNNEIFINGTSPGLEYSLTPDGLISHASPSIFGPKVVWQDGTTAIYLNDTSLPSGSFTPIDTQPGSYPSVPKIFEDPTYGDRVVWQEAASGNEIYLYTSGASGPCPIADFTHDFSGGTAPITVYFTNQSTPGATFWFWNFGDGTNAAGQTATHTFLQNQPYDVSLTVGNPACRNTSMKINNVVVGSPVPDFTASPTADIVPARITFTDLSSGAPTSWLWDFGDGTTSTLQSPSHTYAAIGTYTVNLTAMNAFGSSFRKRTNYISALKGANELANTTIDGITITTIGGIQSVSVDSSVVPAALIPNNSVLEIKPPADRGFNNITLYSFDGAGFTWVGSTITGHITGVHLQTKEINPTGFSPLVGSHIQVNYSVDTASYPVNGVLSSKIWENAVTADNVSFQTIALGSQFSHYLGTGYTLKITKTNFPAAATSRIHMSIDSGWVSSVADGRSQTYIVRISDDGTNGEVLPTRFLLYDPVTNLDYFEADSNRWPSTLGLCQLAGSGNPFQLITLSIASQVSAPSNIGDDSSSGEGSGISSSPQAAINPPPEDKKGPLVSEAVTEKVYTNPQGVVTQASTIKSPDSFLTLTLDKGITAKDGNGNPLSSITIAPANPDEVPEAGSGATFSFAGLAYELGPDKSTFSPEIALSFTVPEEQRNREFAVRTLDHTTNTWLDIPTTYDPATGKVTAWVSDFCCFALFSKPLGTVSPTPLPQPGVISSPTIAVTPPPSTAITIFLSLAEFIFNLVRQNILIIVIASGVAVLFYILGRKRRMDRIRYKL
jgi:beta propeller repeat protein